MKILKSKRGPRFLNEEGQGLTEYLTILILVSLVAVGAAKGLGKLVREKIETAKRHISSDINFEGVK